MLKPVYVNQEFPRIHALLPTHRRRGFLQAHRKAVTPFMRKGANMFLVDHDIVAPGIVRTSAAIDYRYHSNAPSGNKP